MDRNILEDEPFSLMVLSRYPNARFQWRRNGKPIAGATDSRLHLPGLKVKDSGAKFDVVVTCSNGSETSKTATITVFSGAANERVRKSGWDSPADWNHQKPGYEWVFPLIDTNHDGKVTQEEYNRFQSFKQKSKDWEPELRTGGLR